MNWFSNSGSLADLGVGCGDYITKAVPEGFPTESELLFGQWDESGYEGSFYLLWRRNGELFEESMSHCSCNDYSEDNAGWASLKPVTPEYIRMRKKPFYSYGLSEADYAKLLVAWDAVLEVV